MSIVIKLKIHNILVLTITRNLMNMSNHADNNNCSIKNNSIKNTDIVILAGGNSSRMHFNVPKFFLPLSGKPIIHHIIDNYVNYNNIYVVINEKLSKSNYLSHVKTIIQPSHNGTGGALMAALPYINSEYVIVQYADMPLISKEEIDILNNSTADATLMVGTLPSDKLSMPYGRVLLNSEGQFEDIVEFHELINGQSKNNLFNPGFYKFKTECLKQYLCEITFHKGQSELYLPDIFKILKKNNKGIQVLITDKYDVFHGINTMQDLAIAENIYQTKIKNYWLAHGVRIIQPESVYISYDAIIEPNVVIEPYVVIKNNVHITAGSLVKSFSYLQNTTVSPDYVNPIYQVF